ncbi:MAG TPA: DinB family protein [Terriglobales bacterium]|nr:DinB family protein [Terriglobales bacterium]
MTREERDALIAQYARGFEEVARALEGFPRESLTARPLAGKWSAAEIVHHLADSESISAQRLRTLLVQERPLIHGYDQEVYAEKLRYNDRPIEPALAAFRAARETTMQLLRAMKDEDWTRAGWHTESGPYSAETWLRIYSAHGRDHAAQIRRLREALAK